MNKYRPHSQIAYLYWPHLWCLSCPFPHLNPAAGQYSSITSSSLSFINASFDGTLGAFLTGGLVAMTLWGVTCVQTYTYFTRKPRQVGLQGKGVYLLLLES
ncbi:hypothetical protein BDN72DRAFT_261779 [Pluteus cervinus]|uniref:Uncharacterized protein n=1 Tax=Pluteus cervinus TaxID=181527 RepID=A0ACD3AI73_9AGAR|nr:hypothetical protein BDN72DRAFT_261779 [Pluteus cervinus]